MDIRMVGTSNVFHKAYQLWDINICRRHLDCVQLRWCNGGDDDDDNSRIHPPSMHIPHSTISAACLSRTINANSVRFSFVSHFSGVLRISYILQTIDSSRFYKDAFVVVQSSLTTWIDRRNQAENAWKWVMLRFFLVFFFFISFGRECPDSNISTCTFSLMHIKI